MPRHQATPIRRAPGCLWAKAGCRYAALMLFQLRTSIFNGRLMLLGRSVEISCLSGATFESRCNVLEEPLRRCGFEAYFVPEFNHRLVTGS